jgi:hypothetical protein
MADHAHNGKRLPEEGVGPEMRSSVGQEPTPQRETPLAGRRAGDAISGGVSVRILSATVVPVKHVCSASLPGRA